MLTKEQADSISDSLLAQEAQKIARDRNHHARAVHPLYRFPELSSVQPWQRQQIVRSAGKLADKCLPVLLSAFIFVTAVLAVAFFASPQYQTLRVFLVILVCAGVPLALVRRHFMRRYAVALCRQLVGTKSS